MQINQSVLDKVKATNAQLLVVTKYWNASKTNTIRDWLKDEPCVLGWGENRTASLEEKLLPPEQTHFIGRLQSRQLSSIVQHCKTIHSLASLKHAQKLNLLAAENPLEVFIQVNVGEDPSKEGIAPSDLADFLESLKSLENINVIGLSTMGWGDFTENKKRQEFKSLIDLKNSYLPSGLTSAGTSRDYHLALQEGIDIVRVGTAIVV